MAKSRGGSFNFPAGTWNPFIPKKANTFIPSQRARRKRPAGFGSLIRDYDRDGVPNIIDCAPRNRRRHGRITEKIKGYFPKTSAVSAGYAGMGTGMTAGMFGGYAAGFALAPLSPASMIVVPAFSMIGAGAGAALGAGAGLSYYKWRHKGKKK